MPYGGKKKISAAIPVMMAMATVGSSETYRCDENHNISKAAGEVTRAGGIWYK